MGVWKAPFSEPEGKLIFRCRCDNEYFYLTPTAIKCARCGEAKDPY